MILEDIFRNLVSPSVPTFQQPAQQSGFLGMRMPPAPTLPEFGDIFSSPGRITPMSISGPSLGNFSVPAPTLPSWNTPFNLNPREGLQTQSTTPGTPGYVPPVKPTTPTNSTPVTGGNIDSSSPEAFIRSIAPSAKQVADRLNVPVDLIIAMAANETGYGKYVSGNNLFGIKGSGPAGSIKAGTWEQGANGPYSTTSDFRAYNNVGESFNDYADLLSNDYPGALGAQDVNAFVNGLQHGKLGAYMTDPAYATKLSNIATQYAGVIQDALAHPTGGQILTPQTASPSGGGGYAFSQFNSGVGDYATQLAACGPAVAAAMLSAYGHPTDVATSFATAKARGHWAGEMQGPGSEQALLSDFGLQTHVEAPDEATMISQAQNHRPFLIDTPGHYYFIDGYDPNTGLFHNANWNDLRVKKEWVSLADIGNNPASHGPVRSVIYAN